MRKLNDAKKADAAIFLKKDEQRIRENWFVFTIICTLYSILFDAFSLPFQGETSLLAFAILANVIFLCLIYHFAYRKSGTRFLTFIIFIKLSGLIGMMQLDAMPIQGSLVLNYCCIIVDFLLVIGWLFLSLKLRKINLAAKPFRKVAMATVT